MHVRVMCSVCGHGKMTFISHFLMNEGLSQLCVALEKNILLGTQSVQPFPLIWDYLTGQEK